MALGNLGVCPLNDPGGPSFGIHDDGGDLPLGVCHRGRPQRQLLLSRGQSISSVDLELSRLLGSGGDRGDSLSLRLLSHFSSPAFGRRHLVSQPENESLCFPALCLNGLVGLPGFDDQPVCLGLRSLESFARLNVRLVAHPARLLAGTVEFGGRLLAALQCLGSIGLSALPEFANLGLGLATPSLHFGLKSCPPLRQCCLARSTLLIGFGPDPRRLTLGESDKFAVPRLGTALGFCDQGGSLLFGLGNDTLRRGRHLSGVLLSLTMRPLRLRHPSLRLLSHNLSPATRLIQLRLNLGPTLRQLGLDLPPILPNRSLRLGTQPSRLLIRLRHHPRRVLLSLTMRPLRLRHPSLRLLSHNLSPATRLIQLRLNLGPTLRQLGLDLPPILPNRSLRLGTQPSRLLIRLRHHPRRVLLSLRHLGGRGLLDLRGPLLRLRLE